MIKHYESSQTCTTHTINVNGVITSALAFCLALSVNETLVEVVKKYVHGKTNVMYVQLLLTILIVIIISYILQECTHYYKIHFAQHYHD